MEGLGSNNIATTVSSVAQTYMRHVYGWMTIGLAITACTAWFVANSPELYMLLLGNTIGLVVMALVVIALPVILSGTIQRLSAGAATGIFVLYSAAMGAFLSAVLLVYTGASVMSAFVITAGTFGAMSIYGTVTKRDLTSMGSFMTMGLIGVLIAMIVNLFLHNTMMELIISVLCVIIFTGLTVYDTQKLYRFGEGMPLDDATAIRRGALLGALTLYLDFVNLFMAMLRLFGDRR